MMVRQRVALAVSGEKTSSNYRLQRAIDEEEMFE